MNTKIEKELKKYFCLLNETVKILNIKKSDLFFTVDQKQKSVYFTWNHNKNKNEKKFRKIGNLYNVKLNYNNRILQLKLKKKLKKLHFIEHLELKNTKKLQIQKKNKFSILSFNLFNYNENWKLRFKMILNMIKKHPSNILAFQEIRFSGDSDSNFQLNFLKKYLIPEGFIYYTFKCSMIYQHDNQEEGLAIFSKFPITRTKKYLLKRNLNDDSSHQRILIFSEIKSSNGNILQIFNTHLSLNLKMNLENSKEIIDIMNVNLKRKVPQILVGDMNAEANAESIQYFKHFLKDSWEVFGKLNKFQFTFPTKNPTKRIDFIFYRENLNLQKFELMNDNFNGINSSDHFGLISSFNFDK